MSTTLVECIPNFSEGRRPEIVEQIVSAIRGIEGVIVLDYSSDSDHNRSVVTFVGSLAGVEKAAFAGIAKAAELIDLNEHQGEHPRIGATDVVPFVPISGVTMEDCIGIAHRLGKRVGDELNIPVYLYEKAATRTDRENLADLRKGEYEGLKAEIQTNPDRAPDFGPSRLGNAGATVIGARSPLVAYNVYLNTGDATVAEKIARAVRHLSGGLRYVKGLGMLVNGKAQVSMNITNYTRTPVHRVVEMIRREAARYGAQITHSELIGLIPQQALIDAAVWYLQLDGFSQDQILEYKIQTELQTAAQKKEFLDALADGTPAPGGGSAAAYAGAMAAGLVTMVAKLTVGKKNYLGVGDEMTEVVSHAERLRVELTDAVVKDAQAFEIVMKAYSMAKGTEQEKSKRNLEIQTATLDAAKVPLKVAEMAVSVLRLAKVVAERGNLNAITDAGTGAALARTAVSGAGMNVRINLTCLKDAKVVDQLTRRLEDLEEEAKVLLKTIQSAIEERGQISFPDL